MSWYAVVGEAMVAAPLWAMNIPRLPVLGVMEPDKPVGKVNVLPLEGKKLATAHCCFEGQDNERPHVFIAATPGHVEALGSPLAVFQLLQQKLFLTVVQPPATRPILFRSANQRDGIGIQVYPPLLAGDTDNVTDEREFPVDR